MAENPIFGGRNAVFGQMLTSVCNHGAYSERGSSVVHFWRGTSEDCWVSIERFGRGRTRCPVIAG